MWNRWFLWGVLQVCNLQKSAFLLKSFFYLKRYESIERTNDHNLFGYMSSTDGLKTSNKYKTVLFFIIPLILRVCIISIQIEKDKDKTRTINV